MRTEQELYQKGGHLPAVARGRSVYTPDHRTAGALVLLERKERMPLCVLSCLGNVGVEELMGVLARRVGVLLNVNKSVKVGLSLAKFVRCKQGRYLATTMCPEFMDITSCIS